MSGSNQDEIFGSKLSGEPFDGKSFVDSAGNEVEASRVFGSARLEASSCEVIDGERAEAIAAQSRRPFDPEEDEKFSKVTDVKRSDSKPTRGDSREEQVALLEHAIRQQPGHREIYLRILEYCRTPQVLADIENEIATWPEFKLATLDQYFMICTLEKYQGLLRQEMTEDGVLVTSEMKEGLTEDEVDDLVAYNRFLTTDLGRDVAERHAPAKRIRELLDLVAGRKQTYLDVLEFCKERRSYQEIESLLKGRDVLWLGRESLQQPLQPSVFVDKLERAGAIVWDGGWNITRSGREILKEVAALA